MKFANMERLGYKDGKNRIGVGDYIQLIAIDSLYQEMGITEDVVYLNADEITTYRGKTLFLPVNQLISGAPWLNRYGVFSISRDIVPIFLGVSLRKGFFEFNDKNIMFLKEHAPIGCRDYYTFQQVRNYNIPAYMAGCLTMTLPERNVDVSNCKKIYLVDVPSTVKKYIPNNLLAASEVVSHTFQVSREKFDDLHFSKNLAKQLFERYEKEAALVITSRLHCASPCLAMGIPVIVTKQYCGYTFDWLEQFTSIYTEENYTNICWDTGPIHIKEYKELARSTAIKRLKGTYTQTDILRLNEYYMKGYTDDYYPREMSIKHFINVIKERFSPNDRFDYAVWGVSNTAEDIYQYLSFHYPHARMVKVIDSFEKKVFHGVVSEKPDVLTKSDPFITIVATINCMDSAARPLFETLGKDNSQYIYAADPFIENSDIIHTN